MPGGAPEPAPLKQAVFDRSMEAVASSQRPVVSLSIERCSAEATGLTLHQGNDAFSESKSFVFKIIR